MMSNNKYIADLLPDNYYHLYNRSNNKEPLFKNVGNRLYFLQKYKQYVAPFCHTFAYCLLPNHFHFLIQIKSELEICAVLQNLPKEALSSYQKEFLKGLGKVDGKNDISQRNVIFEKRREDLGEAKNDFSQRIVIFEESRYHQLLAKQFRRFFIAYAKAFNKQHKREGNLFNRPFKRVRVADDAHFTKLVCYIHHNPTHHQLTKNFTTYPWSSYQSLLSNQATALNRESVMNWFDGINNFIAFHHKENTLTQIEDLIIEE